MTTATLADEFESPEHDHHRIVLSVVATVPVIILVSAFASLLGMA